MPDQNNPERPQRRKKSQGLPKPVLVIIIILLLVLGGISIFLFSGSDTGEQQATVEPLDTPSTPSIPAPDIAPTPDGEPEVVSEEPPPVIPDMLTDEEPAPEEEAIETPEQKRARECRLVAEQINGFFTHVDSEDYMQQFKLPERSQDYFINLAYKLLKNPPVVSRESDDLYTILKNMAHFFRVIGKDNIILIKTILDRERDKIEDVAAEFYQWTDWGDCNDDILQFSPTLEGMYEYAGFFLNTMGGRSYLFRRDSRSRLLINYYSVLVIERANEQGVNRHGIDLTQIIPQLVQEIESSNQLIYKENYIDRLFALQEKYQ